MALRAYAAAKRTLSMADKLLEVNWGLVLLITLIALGRHRHALFGGRRSFPSLGADADRAFHAWACSCWWRRR